MAIRANGANGKKAVAVNFYNWVLLTARVASPQTSLGSFVAGRLMQDYIWLKPPSNSFQVDNLLCVGQTPNIALPISPSPATT